MSRILHLAATAVLVGASSAALAEINTCDVEVTRERTQAEMTCQQQYGPPSGRVPEGRWHPGWSPALDQCLDRVQSKFRIERWACHGIVYNDTRFRID